MSDLITAKDLKKRLYATTSPPRRTAAKMPRVAGTSPERRGRGLQGTQQRMLMPHTNVKPQTGGPLKLNNAAADEIETVDVDVHFCLFRTLKNQITSMLSDDILIFVS